ncbi:putative enterotoxin [Ophiocordyceps unilateralis]|uniref:Enterotoxin n=1 Tax=Ophiocordyceps unilateralis TaxID=268505 RepID=A0A2A9PBJ8_OPHUN|nr:putative enterotoxin [Ophiocordyceps unilateralis]
MSLWLLRPEGVGAGPLLRRQHEALPQVVYRGDSRSPEVIKAEGGFHPLGEYWNNETAFSLDNHLFVNEEFLNSVWDELCHEENGTTISSPPQLDANYATAYVSTTASPQEAVEFSNGGWVYVIQATPNMLALQEDLFDEVLALGGIRWTQIRGYSRVRDHGTRPSFVDLVHDGHYILNPDFDQSRWGALTASDVPDSWDHHHPSQSALDFMQSVGASVAWTGRFPLLPSPPRASRPETTRVEASDLPGTSRQLPDDDDDDACRTRRLTCSALRRPSLLQVDDGSYTYTSDSDPDSDMQEPQRKKSRVDIHMMDHLPTSETRQQHSDAAQAAIPEPVRRRIEQGMQTDDDCSLILSQLAAMFPTLLHHSNMMWKRWQGGVCERLFARMPRTYLSRLWEGEEGSSRGKCPPSPCRKINKLEIDVKISPNFLAGTWDTILAGVAGRSPHLFIAKEPKAGFQTRKAFNLKQIFTSDQVPLREIDRISLIDVAKPSVMERDQWTLEGVTLRAQCVGSSHIIQVDRYRRLGRNLQHGNSWGPQVVWADMIQISDWHLLP